MTLEGAKGLSADHEWPKSLLMLIGWHLSNNYRYKNCFLIQFSIVSYLLLMMSASLATDDNVEPNRELSGTCEPSRYTPSPSALNPTSE